MRLPKLLAIVAVAAPAIALAQVGPNPAVQGSLDPTVGKTGDAATAPDDSIRGGPEGTVVDAVTAAEPEPATTDTTDAAAESKRTTAPTDESARKPR